MKIKNTTTNNRRNQVPTLKKKQHRKNTMNTNSILINHEPIANSYQWFNHQEDPQELSIEDNPTENEENNLFFNNKLISEDNHFDTFFNDPGLNSKKDTELDKLFELFSRDEEDLLYNEIEDGKLEIKPYTRVLEATSKSLIKCDDITQDQRNDTTNEIKAPILQKNPREYSEDFDNKLSNTKSIQQHEKRTLTLQQKQHKLVNAILDWQKMSPEQRKNSNKRKFAEEKQVNFNTLINYIRRSPLQWKTGLNAIGQELIQKTGIKRSFNPVNFSVLKEWQQLTQDQRTHQTLEMLAKKHNVKIKQLDEYCYLNGLNPLTLKGRQIVQRSEGHKFTKLTPELIAEWNGKPQEEKNSNNRQKFAEKHNLCYATAKRFLKILNRGAIFSLSSHKK